MKALTQFQKDTVTLIKLLKEKNKITTAEIRERLIKDGIGFVIEQEEHFVNGKSFVDNILTIQITNNKEVKIIL